MDEILASIRRIIESGEERTPVGTQSPAGDDAKSAATDSEAAQPASLDMPDVETSRSDVHYLPSALGEPPREVSEPAWVPSPDAHAVAPLPSGGVEPAAEAVPEAQSNQTLPADFAAEGVLAARPALDDAGEEPSAAPRAGNENASRSEGWPISNQTGAPGDFAFEFDDEQFEADLRSGGWEEQNEPRPAGARPHEPETKVPEPANSQDRRMPESVIDGASALLSTQAGDQVAAAFGDLARTIREGHMRSMEEMAREMMRPMLQEWLDDNLPRIVERLVREEIERVARGARY